MNEIRRWQMNRMGFVNFWLYDREIFPFSDGKLMLRGQNASGKSITTQSFIPFILDGDRTPSRLDPFGSNDRKMEYYFLGEDDRDDVTGYLFLEFKRQGVEEYRTIGIGQRAVRGKSSMGFWGFIILDGRRVGIDLELSRNVGAHYIPLSRQELKNLLGEGNVFTDSQKEYMSSVNKYLFGFERLEQYEQFIRLLIKVRAPKLSKEFKPTKVYEILNDSLQTLTDEDLHAMVDAMEKMDEIEMRLDGLRRSARDLRIISDEYRRYNEFVLSKKAEQYLQARRQDENARAALHNLEQKLAQTQEEERGFLAQSEKLSGEIAVLEGKMEAWRASDLQRSVEERQSLTKHLKDLEDELSHLEEILQQRKERRRELEAEIREADRCREEAEFRVEKTAAMLDELQQEFRFEGHAALLGLGSFDAGMQGRSRETAYLDITGRFRKWSQQIRKGLKSIEACEEAQKRLEEAEQKKSLAALEWKMALRSLSDARQMEDGCKDELIEQLYRMMQANEELVPGIDEQQLFRTMVMNYRGETEPADNALLWSGIREKRHFSLERQRREALEKRICTEEELTVARRELERLLQEKELTPPLDEQSRLAREALERAGIAYVPVYRALDFTDAKAEQAGADSAETDRKEQALAEKQLTAMGLLNSLLVAAEDYERAIAVVKEYGDVLVRVNELEKLAEEGGMHPTEGVLCCAGIEDKRLQHASRLLCDALSDRNSLYYLAENGYFRNGLLEGYVHFTSGDAACYVGAQARKNMLERQREEAKQRLEQLNQDREEYIAQEEKLAARLDVLEREYSQAPDLSDLNQANVLVRSQETLEAEKRKDMEEREAEADEAKRTAGTLTTAMIEVCRGLPYGKTSKEYTEAEELSEEYANHMAHWKEALSSLEIQKDRQVSLKERHMEMEDRIDELELQRRNRKRELSAGQEKLAQTDRMLQDPDLQKLVREMEEAGRSLEEKRVQAAGTQKEAEFCKREISRLQAESEPAKERAEEAESRHLLLKDYFLEEWELKLVTVPGSGEVTAFAPEKIAQQALALMRESDRMRTEGDLLTVLLKNFTAHSGSIASYGAALEECFEVAALPDVLRRRRILTAVWQGRKMPIALFYQLIREAIESTEMLIQKKDRELFEDILSDTLSRKLTARIHESRQWIKDMSGLMQQMDTSMGLTFSLRWTPKEAEGEGTLDTRQLEQLLLRDRQLLRAEDIEQVTGHFRRAIRIAKQQAQERGESINYAQMVRDALDYRKWFEFRMFAHRLGENPRELTDRAFNRFSGGEKAMAMYIPLFAAVNAQYRKSVKPDHPRILALDEAFAGVDDKNISSMFALVDTLDFDYIMNSQVLWGCYETVKSLQIAELLRPENARVITVIFYHWNGKVRQLQ